MKIRKFKLLTALIVLLAATALLSAGALADDFGVRDDGTLTSYDGPGGNVVIPSVVTKTGYLSDGTEYTYPVTVTSIGQFAFYSCDNSMNVTIPESVTSIGDEAFYYCKGLTSVTIPNSVTSIGYGAFSYCSNLTSVTIPNSVISIGESAFDGCSSLTSVTIPNSVTSISKRAFALCWELSSVIIPEGVTSIGENAFYCCESLTSIMLPDSVTSIGAEAFRQCSGLTSIELPSNLTRIGDNALGQCSKLEKAVFWNKETNIDGNLFGYYSPVVYCYRDSTAEALALEYGYEIVYIEADIELINPVMDSPIEAFTYACGSFLFDADDCTELELHYTIYKDDEENILPYCDFSITLPDGFSFEEYEVVQTKNDFRGYYNEDDLIEGKITIYPQYSSVCPNELTFEISGGANHKERVSVSRAENEGVVLCQNTAGVSLASSSDPIEMETSKDYVSMFMNTGVSSFNDRINELSCTLTQAIYNQEFIEQSLKNLGFTKIVYTASTGANDVANTFAVKKIVQGGKVENLLMVVIRGTVGVEWLGNLVIVDRNAPGEHADFRNAANNTMQRLNSYCNITGVSKEHTQALICGHSRGGAVTDLLAHDMNVSSGRPVRELRAYTYAAPNSTKNPSRDGNIFNYLFYGDLVGYVPGGYYKHGQTYVVGSSCETTQDVPAVVQQAFRMYSAGNTYSLPRSPMIINALTLAGDPGNWIVSKEWISRDWLADKMSKAMAASTPSTDNASGSKPVKSDILQGHVAEGYLAWVYHNGRSGYTSFEYAMDKMRGFMSRMFSATSDIVFKGTSLFVDPTARLQYLLQLMNLRSNHGGAQMVTASCPVDVEVIDANGTVVASFASHQLVSADQERLFAFSEGETDYILLPQNEGMTVRITGNGEGTMKLGVVCTGADNGDFLLDQSEITESASFTGIPVSAGQTYQLTFAPNGTGVQWSLLDPAGNEYQRDPFSNPLYLPSALTAISDEAYMGCTELTGTIVCPNGMTSIGARAFSGAGLSGVLIPASVTSIAGDAFENTAATIYCAKDSVAHTYAAAHGIPVVILGD